MHIDAPAYISIERERERERSVYAGAERERKREKGVYMQVHQYAYRSNIYVCIYV